MSRETLPSNAYRERLIKLMPSETVASCIAAISLISTLEAGVLHTVLIWIIFLVGLVGTVFWLIYKMNVKKVMDIVLASIAFVIYFMTLEGGPFSTIPGYSMVIGSVLLILFTMLVAPLLTKIG